MINRRDFLKKLGIVCGAAVVCPAELLKPAAIAGIDCNKPGWPQKPGFYDVTHLIKDEETRWPKYYAECQKKHMERIAEAFEGEFWNTDFKSPFMDQIVT